MNFSQGSASNDYIARTAISQCQLVTPDLLLINFTGMARKEHVDDKTIRNLLPAEKPDGIARAFYRNYMASEGLLNAVKNILLVQFFCKTNDINFLFAWVIIECSRLPTLWIPSAGPLISVVDRGHFCDFGLKDSDIFIDIARDLVHPGPRSHNMFASRIYEKLTNRSSACT
jgi:hypothetical protein